MRNHHSDPDSISDISPLCNRNVLELAKSGYDCYSDETLAQRFITVPANIKT